MLRYRCTIIFSKTKKLTPPNDVTKRKKNWRSIRKKNAIEITCKKYHKIVD